MSATAQSNQADVPSPSEGDPLPASEAAESAISIPDPAPPAASASLPSAAPSSEDNPPAGPTTTASPASVGDETTPQQATSLQADEQPTPTTEGQSSETDTVSEHTDHTDEIDESGHQPSSSASPVQQRASPVVIVTQASTTKAPGHDIGSSSDAPAEEISTEGTFEDHGSITDQSLTDEPLSVDTATEEAPPSKKLMPKLFEYFFVVGLESNDVVDLTATDRRYPPKILYHYPEESKSIRSISQIVDFCFPSESFRHNDEQSFIFMLTIDDGKVHLYGICVIKDELLKEYPSFLTSPRASRRSRVAPLPDTATASGSNVPSSTSAPKLSTAASSSLESRNFVVSPRCYCFLSRYPFFRPHFEVIYGLLGQERLLRVQRLIQTEKEDQPPAEHPPPNQPIAIPTALSTSASASSSSSLASTSPRASATVGQLSVSATTTTTTTPSPALTLAAPGSPPRHRRSVSASSAVVAPPGHASSLESSQSEAEARKSAWDAEYAQLRDKERARTIKELNSQEVRDLLSTYYNSPFPQPGERMEIVLPGSPAIACQFPPGDYQALLISDWAMGSCVRALSLENIEVILAAAMLERPVVFASQHLGVLSNSVMSLIPMLRPLVWQGLFVPLLPARMHDLLDAPVPYLFGVQSIPQRLLKRSELTIVFLDSNKLQPATDLFPLPELSKLHANLHPIYWKLRGTNSHPSNSSRQQLLAIQEFSKLIRDYIHEVTDSIFRSLHRQQGFSHVFNPRLFESHEDYKIKKQTAINQFLRRVQVNNRPFVTAFIQTQHFFHYVDQQLKFLKKKRREAAEKAVPDKSPITEPTTTPTHPSSSTSSSSAQSN